MQVSEKKQDMFEIGNISIGGEPGINPTTMIGSMFHRGHKIMVDRKKGEFDRDLAIQQIRDMEEVSRETCLPFIIDVIGNTPENLVKYCLFVADATADKLQPFLMDGLNDEIRVPAMKQLMDAGLGERLIYNSIEPKITDETLDLIQESKVRNAVLLCFDSRMLLPKQKFKLLEGWGDKVGGKEGLINKAKRCGIKNTIVDVAVLDMPSLGIAGETISQVKQKYALPAGCAPSNAIFECLKLKERGREARTRSLVTACSFLASQGADFLLFGSVKFARETFHAVAEVDSFLAYMKRRVNKIRFDAENHPLSRMF
ncbi:MAG: hypothetical protein ACTSUE_27315 [Promethearchaeota archaeon]